MAARDKILENTTALPIDLATLGITIPALSSFTIEVDDFLTLGRPETIAEISPYLISGDILVKDGISTLSAAEGEEYLKHPHFADAQRFQIPTLTGGKQFTQKTTQLAIEESFPRISLAGSQIAPTVRNINFLNGSVVANGADTVDINLSGLPTQGRSFQVPFFNNGNTRNKWLFYNSTSNATNGLPYVSAWNIEVFGILFSNVNTGVNCDVEFYVNGTTNPSIVYTHEVRNQKNSWITTLGSLFQMNIGDSLAVFIKGVGGGNNPSSVQVSINIRIRDNIVGSGGSN